MEWVREGRERKFLFYEVFFKEMVFGDSVVFERFMI